MKRIRLISLVVAVIVFGGLTAAIFRAREPCYQGRTLTEWIRDGATALNAFRTKPDADAFHPETDPDWRAASHAVKQIGPDAIPHLLKWARAKDSVPKEKLIAWFRKHPSFYRSFGITTAHEQNEMAQLGFWLLGSESKPAWPVLIDWTHSTEQDRRLLAFVCLIASKPDNETLMPVLLRIIHDPDKRVQFTASQVCVWMNPQAAEAAGVCEMFPGLKISPTDQTTTNQSSANQPQTK
jgi:hypothetical protein